MKKNSKLVSIILSFLLVLTNCPAAFASTAMGVSIGSGSGMAGDTVSVDISLSDVTTSDGIADGIFNGTFKVTYDSNTLVLDSIINGPLIIVSSDLSKNSSTLGEIFFLFQDNSDEQTSVIKNDGVFATIKFNIKAEAVAGNYPISLLLPDFNGLNKTSYVQSAITTTPSNGNIAVTAAYKAVTDITNVPTAGATGTEVDLTSAIVAPTDATNKTIVWSVKNAGTTGVTTSNLSTGKFTPGAPGTLVLTATIVNGSNESTNYTKDFTITVTAAPVAVTGVTLAPTTLDLIVGGAAGTLNETVNPEGATNKAVTWSSNNEAVATVANGVVTPISAGTATITVTTADGTKTATSEVTVKDLSTIVFANGAAVSKVYGDTGYINTISGDGTGAVTYTSGTPATAEINSSTGEVTLVGAGTTVITATKAATTSHATVTKTYTLTVTEKELTVSGLAATYNPGASAGSGNITITGTPALVGIINSDAVTLTGTATGSISGSTASEAVTVIGISLTGAKAGNYTLTLPTGLTVDATVVLPASTIVFVDGAAVSKVYSTTGYTNAVSGDGTGTVTYTSGTPATATINSSTGEVTLVGVGTTVITATKAATSTHATATNTYTLTVTEKELTVSGLVATYNPGASAGSGSITITGTPALVGIINSDDVTVTGTASGSISGATASAAVTVTGLTLAGEKAANYTLTLPTGLTVDATVVLPASTIVFSDGATVSKVFSATGYINTITGDGTGAVTYTSSTPATATINSSTGVVTLVGVGTTVITATKAATSTHATATNTYTLTVTAAPSTIVFTDGTAVSKNYGTTGYKNTVSGVGAGVVTYTSGTPATATIDSSGEVILVGVGETVITATKAATATHATVTNTYTLTVNAAEITAFDAIANVSAGTAGSATYADATAVIVALPRNVTANTSAVTVPVATWVDTDTYNPAVAGSYTFTATIGVIPTGYANTGGYTTTVEVVVAAASTGGSSSGGGSSTTRTYTIKTSAGEGGEIDSAKTVIVKSGRDEEFNIEPNKGYEIKDVKVDGKSIGVVSVYEFENVKADHTISATFKEIEEIKPEVEEDNDFVDVPKDEWYYDSVMMARNKGWFTGTSDTMFSPNVAMNRGMIVTVLWRIEGQPTSMLNKFNDVEMGMYYNNPVAWAAEKGIVNGYGNNSFGPNDSITREQMASILYRYAQYKGYDTTQGGMAIREFLDYANISEYALPTLAWGVNTGLMQGSNNKLMPKDSATRAQVAAILMRFSENIIK